MTSLVPQSDFDLDVDLCEPHLCRCGALVDAYGTHSLACNRSAAAGRQLYVIILHNMQISGQSKHPCKQRTTWGCIGQLAKDRLESPRPHGGLESASSGTQYHQIHKQLHTSTKLRRKLVPLQNRLPIRKRMNIAN